MKRVLSHDTVRAARRICYYITVRVLFVRRAVNCPPVVSGEEDLGHEPIDLYQSNLSLNWTFGA